MRQLNVRIPDELHSALHARVGEGSKRVTVERALRRELGLPADEPDGKLLEIENRLTQLERIAEREGAI